MNNSKESISFYNLYKSMHKCKSGVMWKDGTINFVINGPSEIYKLEQSLQNGTYEERKHKIFTIYEPKKRDVLSFSFRDRVYHRSLCDNLIYPTMTKSYIYDNHASQIGKGPDKARNRLKCFLQRYFRENKTNDGWVLQCDIKGYYPNMPHEIVKNVFREKLDNFGYQAVERTLNSYPGDIGYNPGSQIIQIAGTSVLDKYDHIVKEEWRIKKYIRFNDDFILIHSSKEKLEQCLEETRKYLKELGFDLNKKTKIYNIKDGITFLGFKFILTDTGKVIRLVSSEKVKLRKRKIRRMAKLVKKGVLPKEKYFESYNSWRAHASKGNSFKLIKRMDKYCLDQLRTRSDIL